MNAYNEIGTRFSEDRIYRYTVSRYAIKQQKMFRTTPPKVCAFIMLNPSVADELRNDPTIRRCIGFCRDWCYDIFLGGNLFAFRATDPKAMNAAVDPVGPDNDEWLRVIAVTADRVVCAWGGTHGSFMNRDQQVWRRLRELREQAGLEPPMALRHPTKPGNYGAPHPLYLPKDSLVVPCVLEQRETRSRSKKTSGKAEQQRGLSESEVTVS
jgi:hypothetical protein